MEEKKTWVDNQEEKAGPGEVSSTSEKAGSPPNKPGQRLWGGGTPRPDGGE